MAHHSSRRWAAVLKAMESFLDILRIIVSIAFIWGIFHFYRAYKNSKALLPEEVGAVSIYTEQAGGQFGTVNWTIPFVRVSCYSRFIAVRCSNSQFVLKIGDVQKIKKEGLVSDGLRIVHNRFDLPEKILIWPRNISKLMEAVETSLRLPENATEPTKRVAVASH
jgi:hypothetical protein